MDALRQAQQKGVVIGLKALQESGPVPRLDIDELLTTKPDTFNLFLLALSELQNDKFTSDKMGYYQITGIHGLPRSYWDGVRDVNKEVNPQWSGQGYCAHSRPTFPTWHRPYLAMYEQTLYAKMSEIAERYPEHAKPKYRKALKDFRLPYWDYYRARNKGTTTMPGIVGPGGTTTFDYDFMMPQVFTVELVAVRRTSDDQIESIENPLNRFIFPTTGGLSTADWGFVANYSRNRTLRYPRNSTDLKGNATAMNATLNREREGNTINILDMIQDYDSFASFSSDSLTPGASGNLEDIHGSYHGLIGGRLGHMSTVPIAAFDPVFWMHHCQIDRWFAVWQAANPDKWFQGQFRDFVNNNGRVSDIAPLAKEVALPFRHPQDSFWNANLSRDTKDFGYLYKDAIGSARDVKKNFADLYTWSARSKTGTGQYGTPPPNMVPLTDKVNKAQVFQYPQAAVVRQAVNTAAQQAPQVFMSAMQTTALAAGETMGFASTQKAEETNGTSSVDTTPVAPGTASSQVAFTNLESTKADTATQTVDESAYSRDWYVDNVVERLALNGSFTIFYFIGKHDKDDIYNYEMQPTMAGLNHIFTSSREACDNCGTQAEEGHLISGTKAITPMLLDYVKIGELADITPANVVPFLIKNLKWRIVTDNNDTADPRTVAGFKVGVSSKLSPLTGTGGGPIYEEYPQVVEQIIGSAS